MKKVSLWQLANDFETYGDTEGWFILVSPDAEDELAGPFATEIEAMSYATAHSFQVVPLEMDERYERLRLLDMEGPGGLG